MSVKVTITENGIERTTYLITGDEMYIQAGPPALWQMGRFLALKMKIKSLERINETLRERIKAKDVKSLEAATVDELLDELKLRSEYFV